MDTTRDDDNLFKEVTNKSLNDIDSVVNDFTSLIQDDEWLMKLLINKYKMMGSTDTIQTELLRLIGDIRRDSKDEDIVNDIIILHPTELSVNMINMMYNRPYEYYNKDDMDNKHYMWSGKNNMYLTKLHSIVYEELLEYMLLDDKHIRDIDTNIVDYVLNQAKTLFPPSKQDDWHNYAKFLFELYCEKKYKQLRQTHVMEYMALQKSFINYVIFMHCFGFAPQTPSHDSKSRIPDPQTVLLVYVRSSSKIYGVDYVLKQPLLCDSQTIATMEVYGFYDQTVQLLKEEQASSVLINKLIGKLAMKPHIITESLPGTHVPHSCDEEEGSRLASTQQQQREVQGRGALYNQLQHLRDIENKSLLEQKKINLKHHAALVKEQDKRMTKETTTSTKIWQDNMQTLQNELLNLQKHDKDIQQKYLQVMHKMSSNTELLETIDRKLNVIKPTGTIDITDLIETLQTDVNNLSRMYENVDEMFQRYGINLKTDRGIEETFKAYEDKLQASVMPILEQFSKSMYAAHDSVIETLNEILNLTKKVEHKQPPGREATDYDDDDINLTTTTDGGGGLFDPPLADLTDNTTHIPPHYRELGISCPYDDNSTAAAAPNKGQKRKLALAYNKANRQLVKKYNEFSKYFANVANWTHQLNKQLTKELREASEKGAKSQVNLKLEQSKTEDLKMLSKVQSMVLKQQLKDNKDKIDELQDKLHKILGYYQSLNRGCDDIHRQLSDTQTVLHRLKSVGFDVDDRKYLHDCTIEQMEEIKRLIRDNQAERDKLRENHEVNLSRMRELKEGVDQAQKQFVEQLGNAKDSTDRRKELEAEIDRQDKKSREDSEKRFKRDIQKQLDNARKITQMQEFSKPVTLYRDSRVQGEMYDILNLNRSVFRKADYNSHHNTDNLVFLDTRLREIWETFINKCFPQKVVITQNGVTKTMTDRLAMYKLYVIPFILFVTNHHLPYPLFPPKYDEDVFESFTRATRSIGVLQYIRHKIRSNFPWLSDNPPKIANGDYGQYDITTATNYG